MTVFGLRGTEDLDFDIISIQTPASPLLHDVWMPKECRCFFVSASDGRTMKTTKLVQPDGKPIRWNETITGFTVGPSSQLTLKVWGTQNGDKDEVLATFIIPYKMLFSSQNNFFVSTAQGAFSPAISVTLSTRRILAHEKNRPPYSARTENSGRGLSIVADNVEDARSCVQEATEALERMEIDSSLVADIVSASHTVKQARESTQNTATFAGIFLDKWQTVSEQLGFVVLVLKPISEIHSYAQLAWHVISYIPTKISEQVELDQSVMDLLDALEHALDLAPDAETLRLRCEQSVNHRRTLKRLLEQINECGHFIQSYMKDVNFSKRFMKNIFLDKKTAIENYRQVLKKLHDDFLSEVIVDTGINVFRILGDLESVQNSINNLDLNIKLGELCSMGTSFYREKGCLPQTRVKFLDTIMNWVNDPRPSTSTVLMLFGQAGTGKSTIAHEVARRFRDMGRLTTSYFFVRGQTSHRESYRFFATLARDLCSRYPAYKDALGKIIHDNPDVMYAQDYTTLFDLLLRAPLQNLHFVGPVFVVIDALDESEDVNNRNPSVGNGNKSTNFHTFLARRLSELPSNFRIFITSRPEAEIMRAFKDLPASAFRDMHMDDPVLSHGVDNDIYAYLRTKLTEAKVDEDSLRELARKAEHLFQWAAVASHYIAYPPPGLSAMQCVQMVLCPTNVRQGPNALDSLYTTVLERFNMEDSEICNRFRTVMGQVLGVCQPLSIDSFKTMNKYAAHGARSTAIQDVSVIVAHLGSLLSNVTPSNSTLPVAPLHTSFRDFLTDQKRSGKFYIDLDNAHRNLAFATLQTMHQTLRFNICEFETSHCLNSEVPDLENQIEKFIPSVLLYSCRFWARHVAAMSGLDTKLFASLWALMAEKFLFWLEVLSVKREVASATTSLLSLKTWLGQIQQQKNAGIHTLQELVTDAIAFVRYFGMPISQSTPHIYLSALPFTPSSSILYKLYSPLFPYTCTLELGRLSQWPLLQTTISAPDQRDVICIAFSRDNEYIAAGLDDGFVCIWNALTGMRVCGLLDAHQDQDQMSDEDENMDEESDNSQLYDEMMEVDKALVTFVSAIVFSYDGRLLATGTSDGRIRIWDVGTGQEAVIGGQKKTLKGHQGAVSSLSFSKDDKQLVSGWQACAVLIWDLETGEMIAGFFTGHNNPVWAASFLPDQEHIISRSGFGTIRAWNTKTGDLVVAQKLFEDLEIPTGTIDSVVHYDDKTSFNPALYSWESNFTPCSWLEAMEWQEKAYTSDYYWSQATAFSSDGKLIATSSPNQTFVWYANGKLAGRLAGGPFNNDRVMCLAFSGDGKQIVSGSWFGIVRVWDIRLIGENTSELAGEELMVPCSVTFSPDGSRIVVGRQDGTLHTFDASTGQYLAKIREGDNNKEGGWAEVAASLHGSLISLVHDRKIYIQAQNKKQVVEPLFTGHGKEYITVAFSPDVDELVAFSTSSPISTVTVCVLNVLTSAIVAGPMQICDSDGLGVYCLALSESKDSTHRVVVACSHAKIFVWDMNSGCVMGPFTPNLDPVKALAFSGVDGRFITSVATDHTVCIWDSTTGNVVRRSVGLNDAQKEYWGYCQDWPVILTQDGRRVAFVGKNYTILVFEVFNEGDSEIVLQDPLLLAGHVDDVNRMAFSRDGQYLATTSEDYTVRVWDLRAAVKDQQLFICSVPDNPDAANFNEALIDNDGWAIYPSVRDGSPLRLVWIPEIHRESLHRQSNVFVVGRQKQARLDLRNFVHGRHWAKCKAGPCTTTQPLTMMVTV